jgi:VanZ family protein
MYWIRKPHPNHIITTLLWVLFIFAFSIQNGESSSLTSSGIAQSVYELLKSLSASTTLTFQDVSLLVRKSAHVFSFTVLMVLVLRVTFNNLKSWKTASWMFCLLIAFLDESIQIFVPGRSSQFSDVVLDMTGATIISILFILYTERKKHANTIRNLHQLL